MVMKIEESLKDLPTTNLPESPILKVRYCSAIGDITNILETYLKKKKKNQRKTDSFTEDYQERLDDYYSRTEYRKLKRQQ